jgi:hypothetical protein
VGGFAGVATTFSIGSLNFSEYAREISPVEENLSWRHDGILISSLEEVF